MDFRTTSDLAPALLANMRRVISTRQSNLATLRLVPVFAAHTHQERADGHSLLLVSVREVSRSLGRRNWRGRE